MNGQKSSCYGGVRFRGDDLRAHIGKCRYTDAPMLVLASSYGGIVDIEIDGLTHDDVRAMKAILDAALARAAEKSARVLEAAE